MTWFRIDDQFAHHHRVEEAGNAAVGLWARAGAWSMASLTDGFIPTAKARSLGKPAEVKALVRTGLWLEVDGGYMFFRWHESADGTKRQETREEAQARKRGARDRTSRWRARRGESDTVGDLPGDASQPCHEAVSGDAHGDASVTERDAVVTSPSSSSSSSSSSESSDELSLSPDEPAKRPSSKPRTRPTSYPEGFAPTPEHRQYAHRHHLDVEAELTSFRDHALMTGRTGIDWAAGFRNWLKKGAEFAAARPRDDRPRALGEEFQ